MTLGNEEGPQGPAETTVTNTEESNSSTGTGGVDGMPFVPPLPEGEVVVTPEQEFTFVFKETEVNLILKALGDLPTKMTFHLVTKIFIEVDKQRQVKP